MIIRSCVVSYRIVYVASSFWTEKFVPDVRVIGVLESEAICENVLISGTVDKSAGPPVYAVIVTPSDQPADIPLCT
jgi:hypothetical protein